MTESTTVVHLVRHGQVHNPSGVLYGRLPDYHLSELGREMADRVAAAVADRDITHVVSSPLDRARETMRPIASALDLEPRIDDRVIEAGNLLEGTKVSAEQVLRHPRRLWLFRNPLRPSWGEPYVQIVRRMRDAVEDARVAAEGHEALVVSHQLPVWILRSAVEGRRLAHDPRHRQCSLASMTSLTFAGDQVVAVGYAEPARDLLPPAPSRAFKAGA